MGEYGSFITGLYHGEKFMGNVSIFPNSNSLPFEREKELRVSSFSATSDRCFPLVILRTIANEGVLLKLEPANLAAESRELEMMHSMCLKEFKTAVIPLAAGTELHLVAMNGRRNMWPCFWGFVLLPGLYSSCLTMLNLRCLALVLDLDETLIVANTMRSFEDRIEALGSKMKGETDAQKVSGMSAELKRYIQDRALLRQYVDNDRVWDNTADKYVSAQVEVVPSSTEGGLPLMRPIVRLQDRNMVFTRINPHVRDTSVLVRLRPAWEELRSYLTAKGRKRFEVFVCTMSEKEYALEMWRLLDPQVQLIKANEILERVVCVKSGSKKSLANVFSSGNCHPKMAMVIDDRLKVWEDRDQSHVHVVPAFAPYQAPQAEINVPLPILCVARNVACDVRGGFFRDFDEGLSKKMAEIDYHADVSTLPQPPVLSNYLVAEEETRPQDELANGNKELSNGMPDAETKKRLAEGTRSGSAQIPIPIPIAIAVPVENDESEQLCLVSTPAVTRPLPTLNETFLDEKYRFSGFPNDLPMLRPITLPQVHSFEPSLQSSLSREEGEVPESELDPDTRRRLLILQHGQDVERTHNSQGNAIDSSLSVKVPLHLTISPPAAPAGGWLGAEEEMSPRQIPKTLSGIVLESDSPSLSKQQSHGPSFFGSSELPSVDGSSHELRKGISEEAYPGGERQRSEYMPTSHLRSSPGTNTANPVSVLQEIAQKCNTKLEFKSLLNTTTKELQFSVEVFFGGEKVGEGIGRTKKEAQYKAADNSVWLMASKYFSSPMQAINIHGLKRLVDSYDEPISRLNTRDPRHFAGLGPTTLDEDAPFASTSGQSKSLDFRHLQESNRAYNPVAALKEYCTMEGINVVFNDMSPALPSLEFQVQGFICQVEVAGRVMGRSSGWTWEDAKQQAAADALRRLRSAPQPRVHPTRMHSPRSPPLHVNKRMRTCELPRRLPLSPHKLSPR